MVNNVIMDIDALDEQNKAYIKIFGKNVELARLSVADHVRMTTLDQKMQNMNMNKAEDREEFENDMKHIVQSLLPDLDEDDIEKLKFDHYIWIRDAVNDRMMKDRGLNDKEIEKAKKSQKKMMLNMDKVVMKNLE